MLQETTALVIRKVGSPFTLETIQLNDLRSDEALVQVQATGVCHTDLSCATGVLPAQTPAVFGHEGMRFNCFPFCVALCIDIDSRRRNCARNRI